METDSETTRSHYNIRAYVRLIIVISIVVGIAVAIGILLYKAHMKGEILKKCLCDDTVIAEDTIDANLSSNITIAECIEKATDNIKKREKIIERIRSLDGSFHKSTRDDFIQLFITENEYLRADIARSISLAESTNADAVYNMVDQSYSDLCDKFLHGNPDTRYAYNDLIIDARNESLRARQEADDKSRKFLSANKERYEILKQWVKAEKELQPIFDKFSPNRHVYIRLVKYSKNVETEIKALQGIQKMADEARMELESVKQKVNQ